MRIESGSAPTGLGTTRSGPDSDTSQKGRLCAQAFMARAHEAPKGDDMNSRRTLRWTAVAGFAAVVVGMQLVGQSQAFASSVPSAQVTSALTAFDSTPEKTVAAACPSGKRVSGGGGRVNAAQHVVLTRLQPVHSSMGDRFVVSASEDETGFAGSWAAQAYAICADPLPGLEIVSASAPGSGFFTGVSASCPAGKSAIGAGGLIAGGQGQVALDTLGEGSSLSFRTTAAGTTDLNGFAGTWSVTAYAVCMTPSNLFDLGIVRVQSASDSTDRKILEARCPTGKRVTGGAAFSGNSDIVVESVAPDAFRLRVQLIARENRPTTGNWNVTVVAFCGS